MSLCVTVLKKGCLVLGKALPEYWQGTVFLASWKILSTEPNTSHKKLQQRLSFRFSPMAVALAFNVLAPLARSACKNWKQALTQQISLESPLLLKSKKISPQKSPVIVWKAWTARGKKIVREADLIGGDLLFEVGGKGWSNSAAKASLVGEAWERRAMSHPQFSPTRYALFSELSSPKAMLQPFSKKQCQQRRKWNQQAHPFHFIPETLPQNKKVRWVYAQAFNKIPALIRKSNLQKLDKKLDRPQKMGFWVPQAAVSLENSTEHRFWLADSNGVATGHSLSTACMKGLMELIERDAVGIWWYNKILRPQINFSNDAKITHAKNFLQQQQRSLTILDLTHDLGVPVYAAISADKNGKNILFGFGCHFDAVKSARAAVAELLQGIFGFFGPHPWKQHPTVEKWFRTQSLKKQSFLQGLPARKISFVGEKLNPDFSLSTNPKTKNLETIFVPNDTSIPTEIRLKNSEQKDSQGFYRWPHLNVSSGLNLKKLLQRLEEKNIKVGFVVIKKKTPVVVKVIAPELCHFWPRFGAQRLYQVPVTLGWRKKKSQEKNLNPWPMFM